MAGNAAWVPLRSFGTRAIALACAAPVPLEQLGGTHTPDGDPMELTTHLLLLLVHLELEIQTPVACDCDESQTDPALECTKWQTFAVLRMGAATILCQSPDVFWIDCLPQHLDGPECVSPEG